MPRPVPSFRNFVGHTKTVQFLCRQLDGAKARGEAFPSTMIIGPSGSGKTELANALAAEYGTTLVEADGYHTVDDLIQKFQLLEACDFCFIDEAQNLGPKCQELLYQVIDHHRLPAWQEKTANGPSDDASCWIELPSCTVILATDQPGRLNKALKKRIEIRVPLGYYNIREMREIVDRLATNLNLLMSKQAGGAIARISGGLPRTAKYHLQNLRRHFPDAGHGQIGIEDVRRYQRDSGIDVNGLGKTERDFLRYLLRNQPTSLESISLFLGLDVKEVCCEVEPMLKRLGLVHVHGGRRLTAKGREYITQSHKKP